MSLFDWLLVGHLVGDFLLQTDNMARYKERSWPWMLRHVGAYVAVMLILIVAYAVSHVVPFWAAGGGLLFIGVTHFLLDRRDFTQWWMRLIGISANHTWLSIVVDQTFHLLVLAGVAQILVMTGR
jgi:hypothetical protein